MKYGITSHALIKSDFNSKWYKHWAKLLKQDKAHLDNHDLRANKFWQNSVMAEVLDERGFVKDGVKGIGFGVGQERLPALFASKGVRITATDQDSATEKAKLWSEHELATGLHSLNSLAICENEKFKKLVEYKPVDMTKIPKSLHSHYDFVWSNCALGHLGSIEKGLGFIEQSLNCLVPGGWAVHTTEMNALSDRSTVGEGSTVVFRLRDIFKLFLKLTRAGYTCSPLNFQLGNSASDLQVSMRPQFGNSFSKIQVGGHIATQVLLIIEKPSKKKSSVSKFFDYCKHTVHYIKGLYSVRRFRRNSTEIREALKSSKIPVTKLSIKPLKPLIQTTIRKGEKKDLFIEFVNDSPAALYGIYSRLGGNMPIVIGTSNPKDRKSTFVDESWVEGMPNRPGYDLRLKKGKTFELADYIKPRQNFAIKVTFNSQKMKNGIYEENFTLVQENKGWIEDSTFNVRVRVI